MLINRPALSSHASPALGLKWEETDCLLCGRADADLIAEAADPLPPSGEGLRFAVVQCRHCGLAYTNPRPTPKSMDRFYPVDYSPHAGGEHLNTHMPTRLRCKVFGRPCRERRGYLPWQGQGRLLDFGCGAGLFLQRMAELGWKVSGLDISPRVVDRIRSQMGLAAFRGTLPHPDLEVGSFDVITMWQSLEHVHQPLDALRNAYELLSPGGKVVISVPNYSGLSSRMFGGDWLGLELPRHLTHFTPETLEEMLRVAGFRIESIRGVVHAEWMRVSAERAARKRPGSILSQCVRWKPIARLAAWSGYLVGRADSLLAIAQRPE